MRRNEWLRLGREWLAGLLCVSLVIAPFGCQLRSGGLFGDLFDGFIGPGGSSTGLFINEITDDKVLVAARGRDGDAFFAFGSRDAQGDIEQIDAITVRQRDGAESFILFESGRPVHVENSDGSFLDITYEEVTAQRLRARVALFDAADATTRDFVFEIDPQQAARDVAQRIREATGRAVPTTEVVVGNGKSLDRGQVRVTIMLGGILLPLAFVVGSMLVVLGQIAVLLVETVALALQSVVIAILTPLFVISELFNSTVVNIRIVPLSDLFDELPTGPHA